MKEIKGTWLDAKGIENKKEHLAMHVAEIFRQLDQLERLQALGGSQHSGFSLGVQYILGKFGYYIKWNDEGERIIMQEESKNE
jgi:hypothetical protein